MHLETGLCYEITSSLTSQICPCLQRHMTRSIKKVYENTASKHLKYLIFQYFYLQFFKLVTGSLARTQSSKECNASQ